MATGRRIARNTALPLHLLESRRGSKPKFTDNSGARPSAPSIGGFRLSRGASEPESSPWSVAAVAEQILELQTRACPPRPLCGTGRRHRGGATHVPHPRRLLAAGRTGWAAPPAVRGRSAPAPRPSTVGAAEPSPAQSALRALFRAARAGPRRGTHRRWALIDLRAGWGGRPGAGDEGILCWMRDAGSAVVWEP